MIFPLYIIFALYLQEEKKKVWLYYFFTLLECCEQMLLTFLYVISKKKWCLWCSRRRRLHRHHGAGPSRSQHSSGVLRAQQHHESGQAFPASAVITEGMSPWHASYFTVKMWHHYHWVTGWKKVHFFTTLKVYKLKSPENLPPCFSLIEKIMLYRHAFQFQIHRLFFFIQILYA